MQQKLAAADIAIFGGGIAGLWLLTRLRQAGFSAILFESGTLGGGQTNKSQGIIHGGMKYALQGMVTADAAAMSDMPNRWQRALKGEGEINLSQVPILSAQHYLWSPNKLTAKLAGFFAGMTLASKIAALDRASYPFVFQHPDFKGEVYALDELVINVPVLVRELVKLNHDAIFKIEPVCQSALQFDDEGKVTSITVCIAGKAIEIQAQQFVFTAGSGNEGIIKKLKTNEIAMQRRPLHMVLVKLSTPHVLYAHCLGFGTRPRMTVTTHFTEDGSAVWYLGGQLAEDGVSLTSAAQIKAAEKELRALFPWINFKEAEFATFMVDRAEALQKNGFKPESVFAKAIQNVTVAWPTKLALAPKLADEIIKHFKTIELTPKIFDTRELYTWPMPPLAEPIWESIFAKTTVR